MHLKTNFEHALSSNLYNYGMKNLNKFYNVSILFLYTVRVIHEQLTFAASDKDLEQNIKFSIWKPQTQISYCYKNNLCLLGELICSFHGWKLLLLFVCNVFYKIQNKNRTTVRNIVENNELNGNVLFFIFYKSMDNYK